MFTSPDGCGDWVLPPWAGRLANLYFMKRWCRQHDNACRRRAWRRIATEKKRLLSLGVSYIEVHLVCRILTNPRNQAALSRYRRFLANEKQWLDMSTPKSDTIGT